MPLPSATSRSETHAPATSLLIVAADAGRALSVVGGISLLERQLRTLQRLGFREATIVAHEREVIAAHLERPSWARSELRIEICGADPGHNADTRRLVLAAEACFDARLLSALLERTGSAALVDSAPPAIVGQAEDARTASGAVICGAAIVSGSSALHLDLQLPLPLQIAHAVDAGALDAVDVQAQPTYVANLRRHLRPIWFPAPAAEDRAVAEAIILDAAQNGTLDLPAKVHAPIETWIIARLCKTNITPNQITLITAVVSACVTVLFGSGQLLAGTVLALIVGVLDGLDGKQARVKVETTKLGKREHVLDYVLELSWWTALAYHFTTIGSLPTAFLLLALLVGSDLVDRLAKRSAKKRISRNLDDYAPIDRFVRLIGGRRNIYVWILAAGLAAGIPDKAFVALCGWGALTAAVHVLRAVSIASKRASD